MIIRRGLQRLSAVALVAAALIAVYLGLIHWWLVAPLQHIAEEEQTLRSAYLRYATLEARRSFIQTRLEETRQRPLPKGSFLVASGAEAATAQLMQLISSRIAPNPESGLSCSIKNRLAQAAQQAGEVLKIRVDVELECGVESLTKTLYRMETEPPFLTIDALSIRRVGSMTAQSTASGALAVQLQISGYLSNTEVTIHE